MNLTNDEDEVPTELLSRLPVVTTFGVVAAALTFGACSKDAEVPSVVSHLSGTVTVRAEVDSVRDYRGFEILVASADGLADTLGLAVTDSTGHFDMTVTAPEKGIYPLMVRRRGALLKQGQLVVANGDSATLVLRIPDGRRPLVIRSLENAAWLAYRNTKAVHNRELLATVQSADFSAADRDARFLQTASLLWNVWQQFPETIGAEVAGAESVLLLEGIDDSLAVARAGQLDVDGPAFANVARAVRRSESRLKGLDAAIGLLESYERRATVQAQRGAIASEVVLAFVDSGRVDEALEQARNIASHYADTEWAKWAEGAIYELENLMPGMDAPAFRARTWSGGSFDIADFRDEGVVLEFLRPEGDSFFREMSQRDSLVENIKALGLTYVAVSLEPDSVLNEAFFESRDHSSFQIALPEGAKDPQALKYNVNVVPKRFLVHHGRIAGKYAGTGALTALRRDAYALVDTPPSGTD